VRQILRARSVAIKSLNKLERHRRDMRTLVRGKYHHTGYAFVTFNKAAVAREVVRRLTKGGTDEQRLESVLVRTPRTGASCLPLFCRRGGLGPLLGRFC
jgi:hypothetical protein